MIAFLTPRMWKSRWPFGISRTGNHGRVRESVFPDLIPIWVFSKQPTTFHPGIFHPDVTLRSLPSHQCAWDSESKKSQWFQIIHLWDRLLSWSQGCSPPPPPRLPPHSNNCPPPPRKSPEPLENSITGLHERFKIMVLSLCEERERTWPPAAARCWRSVARAWVGGATHRGSRWGFFVFVFFFVFASSLQRWKPDGGVEARAREAADIPCKAVYQWPVGRTLGAAQHA